MKTLVLKQLLILALIINVSVSWSQNNFIEDKVAIELKELLENTDTEDMISCIVQMREEYPYESMS